MPISGYASAPWHGASRSDILSTGFSDSGTHLSRRSSRMVPTMRRSPGKKHRNAERNWHQASSSKGNESSDYECTGADLTRLYIIRRKSTKKKISTENT